MKTVKSQTESQEVVSCYSQLNRAMEPRDGDDMPLGMEASWVKLLGMKASGWRSSWGMEGLQWKTEMKDSLRPPAGAIL